MDKNKSSKNKSNKLKNNGNKKEKIVVQNITEPKGFTKNKPQQKKNKEKIQDNNKNENKPNNDTNVSSTSTTNDEIKEQNNDKNISSSSTSTSVTNNRNKEQSLGWDENPKYMENISILPKKNIEQKNIDNTTTSNKNKSNNETDDLYLQLKFDSNQNNPNQFFLKEQIETKYEDHIDENNVIVKQLKVICIDSEDEDANDGDKEEFMIDDLPPVFPDVGNYLEELNVGVVDDFTIHDFTKYMKFWKPQTNIEDLFDVCMASDVTTLEAKRNPITGEIIEFCEVPIKNQDLTSKNSMSWERAPEPFDEENITGHSTSLPYFPGGFAEPNVENSDSIEPEIINFKDDLLVDPPGYFGLNFEDDGKTVCEWDLKRMHKTVNIGKVNEEESEIDQKEESSSSGNDTSCIINLLDSFGLDNLNISSGLWESSIPEIEECDSSNQKNEEFPSTEEEEKIIPKNMELPVLKISNVTNKKLTVTEYAEMLDVSKPVLDFDAKVPIMAHTWPFELDIFQKQAIIKLEEHNHVFVAAHTSAGKTVIAEYAIALSQNHKTRTIYTSPIKALSNQKYRDFRDTFQDVGLVTGDFQINTTASCLVMTTEILRSMLYRGSDVLRDLEYVIFDEVHYINDSERGHVWEEVLILLPKEVCIVMLSATVPNTLEFADWVGCTKKTKVYVVSTLNRPVPLKHFLYVGSVPNRDQLFLIREAEGEFIHSGYNLASEAKRSSSKKSGGGGGGPKRMGRGAEKTIFTCLLKYLNTNEKLPVVIFTLSRKRCDGNAENLLSLDFTSQKEKSKIHKFFNDSIKKLQNDDDRNLPQVKRLEVLLKNGIGVHHSGILPILKEIVEMLFQQGLVKILFATETFAMGVNMPARTVAFDSIRKFDGNEQRNLLPAEYIQMAGRAGRRGLDENGTVIIMCKEENIASVEHLKKMMLGKQTKLESRFRLTYSMILNLMRVSMVNVEEMMSMSFKEFGLRFNAQKNRETLENLEKKMEQIKDVIEDNDVLFEQFIDEAKQYLVLRTQYNIIVEKSIDFKSCIVPGNVLHIWTKEHRDKLGLLCKVETRSKIINYRLLIFLDNNNTTYDHTNQSSNSNSTAEEEKSMMFYQVLDLLNIKPGGLENLTTNHTIINVDIHSILSIVTCKPLKLNYDNIINSWECRQQPRFRNNPIGETTQAALSYLRELYLELFQTNRDLDNCNNNIVIKPIYEILKSKQLNILELATQVRNKKLEVDKHFYIIQENKIPFDTEMFYRIFRRKENEEKICYYKHLLSKKGMSLYGDYDSKVKVLQDLNYINSQGIVQLKGSVACALGNYELVITELLFENKLVKYEPEEIAALLSSMVFQSKTEDDPTLNLPPNLKNGIKIITDMNAEIEKYEMKHDVNKDGNFEKLNFGLVQVVYEWAMQKPFKEIMMLTDVQEGIIVRCIQQLVELLRCIKDGAKIFGERDLPLKMDQAIQVIKRDIVFAPSLYTT